jgi:hypothetical protein
MGYFHFFLASRAGCGAPLPLLPVIDAVTQNRPNHVTKGEATCGSFAENIRHFHSRKVLSEIMILKYKYFIDRYRCGGVLLKDDRTHPNAPEHARTCPNTRQNTTERARTCFYMSPNAATPLFISINRFVSRNYNRIY